MGELNLSQSQVISRSFRPNPAQTLAKLRPGYFLSGSMIAKLTGQLIVKAPSHIILDVQGVGYEVHVPLSTFYGLGEPGSNVSLRIHTHVRDDTLALFGFASTLELQLFERLISVNGIGPRLALTALSGIEPPELVRTVQQGDEAQLTGKPEVGKKTAERMVVELKDNLPDTSRQRLSLPPW